MSQSDVDKIKERLGIEEVIGTYVKLEKAGKNLKARCPFHNEKTPSFNISPERASYYCFGCGAKGDIFTFVQEFEGMDFRAALKFLADRAGITLTENSSKLKNSDDKLRRILELSVEFYQALLAKKPDALKYLIDRGLTQATIKEWKIGFAPDGWQNLMNFLKDKKFSDADMEKVGLIKKGDKGKYYDRFRSRIMFPIFDSSGRPVGFSGRIFNGKPDEAKYLNSPETLFFDKSRILYGFDRAKSVIRKNDFSILVEGQMDLIMCHQAGYKNTVASSGTALTREQLEKLFRISERLVIAYDSDGAGFRASEKAWHMALSLGMDVKIAPIPDGYDPADVIKEDKEKWKHIVKNSRHIIEIIIEHIQRDGKDERDIGKQVSSHLIPYLANISSHIDQAHFVKMVSELLRINDDSIRAEISKFTSAHPTAAPEQLIPRHVSSEESLEVYRIAEKILAIAWWQEKDTTPHIAPTTIYDAMRNMLGDEYQKIYDQSVTRKDVLVFEVESLYGGTSAKKILTQEVKEMLVTLHSKYLTQKKAALKAELQNAEAAKDEKRIASCLQAIQDITKQIKGLGQ